MKKSEWKLYSGADWTLRELGLTAGFAGVSVAVGWFLACMICVW